MKDKSHIYTAFVVIVILVIIAFIADKILTPKSYGDHGHFRWDAVKQIASQKIINQNIKACKECHNEIYVLHEKDAHFNVPCVDCHGAANKHVAYYKHDDNSKNITKEQAALPKEYKLEGCLYCHRKLRAKPSDFPQVNTAEHFKFLHVTDPNTKCTECHNPHEPIFLLTEARQARLHPIVYKCADCHSKPVKSDYSNVADHPKIFECKDCHSEIVADFKTKPHSKNIECRTCHLFHKENENIGRMYKNGNARFCLLCHENKSFKNPDYPPKIEFPDHISKIGFMLNINQKICLNCHADKIHKMNLSQNKNPHPFNWKADHTKFAFSKKTKMLNTACNSCHQKDFCSSCHGVDLPHPGNILDIHPDLVAKKGKKTCSNCHKGDFCKTCHD
jgi:hypothetical protein